MAKKGQHSLISLKKHFLTDIYEVDEQMYPSCSEAGVGLNSTVKRNNFLCENFTADFMMTATYHNFLSDIVSETRDGLIIIVAYSYKHYSTVVIEATVRQEMV